MSEQCTQGARRLVEYGRREARDFGHGWIGTEHLLLAVLAHPTLPAVGALGELGITRDTARAALAQTVGTGEVLGASEAEALRAVGIDLEQVRDRVEAAFGAGALDRPSRHCQPRRVLPWRGARPQRAGYLPSDLPLTPKARKSLERSRNEASKLGDGRLRVEHVLLGLLDPRGNMAVDLLRHLGADRRLVRARVTSAIAVRPHV